MIHLPVICVSLLLLTRLLLLEQVHELLLLGWRRVNRCILALLLTSRRTLRARCHVSRRQAILCGSLRLLRRLVLGLEHACLHDLVVVVIF